MPKYRLATRHTVLLRGFAHCKCEALRFLTRPDSLAVLAHLAAASVEPPTICYPHASPVGQEPRRKQRPFLPHLSSLLVLLIVIRIKTTLTISSKLLSSRVNYDCQKP